MKIIRVLWADAWGEDHQIEIDAIDHRPEETYTVGFEVKNDEVGITLAMDSYPNNTSDVRNTAFIPSGMIREITYLNQEQNPMALVQNSVNKKP